MDQATKIAREKYNNRQPLTYAEKEIVYNSYKRATPCISEWGAFWDGYTHDVLTPGQAVDLSKNLTAEIFANEARKETVNHPAHYGGAENPYEVIKVIEAWDLDFSIGNAVKYLARAGKKGPEKEDLEKAVWYINWKISRL